MAITVNKRTIVDGEKLAVIHFTGHFTATTGEEADAVKVDASTLSGTPTNLKVMRIWYTNSVAGTVLEFEGATDAVFLVLDQGSSYFDYRDIGGITNNATTPTGDISLTTLGTAAAGEGYTVTIEVSKS